MRRWNLGFWMTSLRRKISFWIKINSLLLQISTNQRLVDKGYENVKSTHPKPKSLFSMKVGSVKRIFIFGKSSHSTNASSIHRKSSNRKWLPAPEWLVQIVSVFCHLHRWVVLVFRLEIVSQLLTWPSQPVVLLQLDSTWWKFVLAKMASHNLLFYQRLPLQHPSKAKVCIFLFSCVNLY